MPSITDAINEKFHVSGANIADAFAQVAGYAPGQGPDNIADAIAAAKDKLDADAAAAETPEAPAEQDPQL